MENRRAKVELYEQIRREHEHGAGTIRAVARKFGVHRREVRKALASAMLAERKIRELSYFPVLVDDTTQFSRRLSNWLYPVSLAP